jgi:hypothetical protein
MNFYLNYYSKNTLLSTEETLYEENEKLNKRLDGEKEDLDQAGKDAIRELKKKLYGRINIQQIPFEIQEEFIRSKLNIPPHIWNDYEPELRGKTMAVEIVKNQIESIEDFYREVESARKGNK